VDLKEQAILGDAIGAHWYYRAKAAAVGRMLRGLPATELLDVGAGSGFFARSLLQGSAIAAATCVDPGYDDEHDELVGGKPLRLRRDVAHTAADLVLLMDVIEHVDDDVGLVRDCVRKVPRGARFLVTAPAFQALWSAHDVFLEHRRRYTLPGVEAVLRAAGLSVERGCYFYGALFPLAAATRLLGRLRRGAEPRSQMRSIGALPNTVLLWACRAELPFFRANRLAGLTAMVLAAKP
jgi:SAM-dependent methyltransferase